MKPNDDYTDDDDDDSDGKCVRPYHARERVDA